MRMTFVYMYMYCLSILGAVVSAAADTNQNNFAAINILGDQSNGGTRSVGGSSRTVQGNQEAPLAKIIRVLQDIDDESSNDFLISSPPDMQMQGRNTEQTDTKICELMQGMYTEGDRCRICPLDSPDRECCVYNLKDFSFICEKCLVVDGQEVCGQVDCVNDLASETISCNGCTGGDSSLTATARVDNVQSNIGDVCVTFTCPSEGRCSCDAASLDGEDCRTCDIDGGKKSVLNCATTSNAVSQRCTNVAAAMFSVFLGFSLALIP